MKLKNACFAAVVLCFATVASAQDITGSGDKGYIVKFNGTSSVTNSRIFQDGTGVGINTASPAAALDVSATSYEVLQLDGPQPFLLLNTSTTYQSGIEFRANGTRLWDIFTDTGGTTVNNLNFRDVLDGGTRLFIDPTGKVGISTTAPTNILTIEQGAGDAIADGWTTYSSRRFKTNIHPLLGALEKVEQLQGVSYDRKSDGRSEIGVVAEDVAEVVPEVVSRDPKTHAVQGVDYSRLAALLIEAVKSQQNKIDSQQADIDKLKEKGAEIDQLKEQLRQLTIAK